MHSFSHIAVLGALLAAVAAIPMKRELIINTVTEVEVVTEILTATVWVDATDAPASYHEAHYTQGSWEHHTSAVVVTSQAQPTTTSSVYVAPPRPTTTSTTSTTTSSTSSSSSTSQAAAVYTAAPQPAPPVPTPTSVYVAPAPVTTSTSEYVAPAPAYTPPTTTTTTAPASTTSSHKKGEITYYDVGQGSCGDMNSDSELVVAIPFGVMNKPAMCGKSVTISYQGSTQVGKIVDTCMGCKDTDLDLSPALFKLVAPGGDGRVKNVEWWFN